MRNKTRALSIIGLAMMMILLVSGIGYVQDYDLGGRTINVVSWTELSRLQEAEEKFNVKINWIPTVNNQQIETVLSRLLAGESEDDIWLVSQEHFWTLLAQNALLPVNDLVPEGYFENNLVPERQAISEMLSFRGNKYVFDNYFNMASQYRLILWNKDLFAREGFPDLYELYENGEWTWDAFEQILHAGYKDTDGDGQIDQWGLGDLGWDWHFTNGGKIVREIDGRMVFTLDESANLEVLTQIGEWGRTGKILTDTDLTQFKAGNVAMASTLAWRISRITDMEDDYGIVPYPLGPSGDKYVYPAAALNALVLPVNSRDPEALIALVDYVAPADDWVRQVESYVMSIARDRQSARILLEGTENWGGEAYSFTGVLGFWYNGILGNIRGQVANGSKTAAAAVAEQKAAAQSRLDELFSTVE